LPTPRYSIGYSVQPPLLALRDFFESDTDDRLLPVLSALDLDPLLQRWIAAGVGAGAATPCG